MESSATVARKTRISGESTKLTREPDDFSKMKNRSKEGNKVVHIERAQMETDAHYSLTLGSSMLHGSGRVKESVEEEWLRSTKKKKKKRVRAQVRDNELCLKLFVASSVSLALRTITVDPK